MFRITTNFCLKFLLLLNIFNGIHAKTKETLQTSNDQIQPQLTSSNEPCNSIKDGSSFDKFEKCKMDNNYIGNSMAFVRLDFSKAKDDEITTFFGQAQKDTTLSAAIKLANNSDVTDVNFGEIKEWRAANMDEKQIFIEIVNNVNLKEFKFDKVENIDMHKKVTILIYNNPLLTWEKHEKDIILEKMDNGKSVFETEKFACTFQNPQDKKQSIKPNPELLPNCKIFRGDLKLESVSLSGNITFKDGCLHLVKVNMENVTAITAEADKGGKKCELAGVQPKIEDNPHLCGNKMAMVAAYTPNVTPKLDDTCTIICKDQDKVNDKFYRCGKIETEYLDYKHWFEPGYERIADKLTEAKDISIRNRGNVEKIDFPVLTTVENLVISNNSALKTLELKALLKAKTLTIKNNPQLTLNEIKKLSKDLKKGPDSEIECIATASTIVTDIEALRHCTKIIGPMIIRYPKNDVDPANFNIKEVTDCMTIEDTQLTNLRFLESAKFGCTETHKLEKNIRLCKPEFLGKDGAAIEQIDGKTNDCGKKCTSLSEKNCVIFEGDLTVDDKTLSANLAVLEVINGKLTITSAPRTLEFPALTSIVNSKAPALVITNNPKLSSIKMPKIERIEAGDEQPIVQIENSPELKDFKLFLPAKIAETCSRSASTSCQYDRAEEKSWLKENIPLLAAITSADVVLAVAAVVGVFFYKRYKKNKKSKAKTARVRRFAISTILFLGQLELALTVVTHESRYLNGDDHQAFLIVFIVTAGTFLILCLASVIMDVLQFIINKKRYKRKVRPANRTNIKLLFHSMKIFLVLINLVAIFLWHEYHGILSLDMSQATVETLKNRQNLEVTVTRSIIIMLLELIVLVFVETYLLSFGPRIRRRLRKKKQNTRKTTKRIKNN